MLLNTAHPECRALLDEADAPGSQVTVHSDEELAGVLGYPVSFSESWMYSAAAEVGYNDRKTDSVLMSFAVPLSWVSAAAHPVLAQHFVQHKKAAEGIFDLEILVSVLHGS